MSCSLIRTAALRHSGRAGRASRAFCTADSDPNGAAAYDKRGRRLQPLMQAAVNRSLARRNCLLLLACTVRQQATHPDIYLLSTLMFALISCLYTVLPQGASAAGHFDQSDGRLLRYGCT